MATNRLLVQPFSRLLMWFARRVLIKFMGSTSRDP